MVNGSQSFRALLLGFFFVLAACGTGGGTNQNQGPIKVGITGPFSGSLADPGTDIRNAGQLAIDDINKAGGINGRKLEAVPEDDACDAQQGVQAAEKLLNAGIVALVGGYCSGASIPESDILHRNGNLPFINAASGNPKFTEQGYDNVFRVGVRDDQEAPADVGFMKEILKTQKVAIMHDNTTYSKGAADAAKQSALSVGIQVVYFDAITPGQKDYTAALTKVGTTGADTLFFTGYFPEFGLLAKQYVQLHPSYKLNGNSVCADLGVLTVAGTALNNPGITINALPTTGFLHNPKNDAFSKAYKARFGHEPGDYAAYEYDGMMVLAEALKDNGGNTAATALNEALHKIHITGITGDVSFDSKGDRPEPQFFAVRSKGDPPGFVIFATRDKGTWKLSS